MFQNTPGLGPVPTPGPGPIPPRVCRPGLSCSPPTRLPERNNQSAAFNRRPGRQLERGKSRASSLGGPRALGEAAWFEATRTGRPSGPQRTGWAGLVTTAYARPLSRHPVCLSASPPGSCECQEGKGQIDASICANAQRVEQTLKMVITVNLRTGLRVRHAEVIQFGPQLHRLQLIFERVSGGRFSWSIMRRIC